MSEVAVTLAELSNDEVVAMPLDRLALLVLQEADSTNAWNWRNDMLGYANARSQTGSKPALDALAEAWNWLIIHGLIAAAPNSNYDFHGVHITRAGRLVLERGLPFIRASIRLDVELMPVLEMKARPQFLLGDYELAAFAAMKEVEVAVRAKAGLGNELLGTGLMQAAFKAGGPLFDEELHAGESVAQMNLFAGAIGLFKNPASHRRVDYTDPAEASEVVMLADLLLRLLAAMPSPPLDDDRDLKV